MRSQQLSSMILYISWDSHISWVPLFRKINYQIPIIVHAGHMLLGFCVVFCFFKMRKCLLFAKWGLYDARAALWIEDVVGLRFKTERFLHFLQILHERPFLLQKLIGFCNRCLSLRWNQYFISLFNAVFNYIFALIHEKGLHREVQLILLDGVLGDHRKIHVLILPILWTH